MEISKIERIKGGIVGLLVGDALGVPYEFHDRQSIPPLAEIEFEPPDYFRRAHAGVSIGTWSDDGAQALILLDSLLERGAFDAKHFAKGLTAWYDNGFMAVGGKVFDVGIQTANSIRELKRGVLPLLAGGTDEYSNGNGSLMRVLPLALWHKGSDLELIADAFDQSAGDARTSALETLLRFILHLGAANLTGNRKSLGKCGGNFLQNLSRKYG